MRFLQFRAKKAPAHLWKWVLMCWVLPLLCFPVINSCQGARTVRDPSNTARKDKKSRIRKTFWKGINVPVTFPHFHLPSDETVTCYCDVSADGRGVLGRFCALSLVLSVNLDSKWCFQELNPDQFPECNFELKTAFPDQAQPPLSESLDSKLHFQKLNPAQTPSDC